jgi:2,4-dienoyl-CoA reductase-like NADH-dependent reductase (Old Yellow Enzyme family)
MAVAEVAVKCMATLKMAAAAATERMLKPARQTAAVKQLATAVILLTVAMASERIIALAKLTAAAAAAKRLATLVTLMAAQSAKIFLQLWQTKRVRASTALST